MLVLLAGIFVVHIATVVMLFVATIANVWLRRTDGAASIGIWKLCDINNCTLLPSDGDDAALRSVQAFMILSIIFSCIALMTFIAQLFTLEKGCRFFITGSLMLICWLCILIAASIYTARFANSNKYGGEWYHGYCFILAWVCFCLSLLAAILYLVLRKK